MATDIQTKPHGDALMENAPTTTDGAAQTDTDVERKIDREAMIGALTDALADVYRVYFKAQVFHWNVTGPNFKSLHDLFEVQYTDLAAAIDTIAERIRTLGGETPTTLEGLLQRAAISTTTQVPSSNVMLRTLAADHRLVAMNMKLACEKADEFNDEGTLDLLGDRIRTHEKFAWMCESSMS